MIAFILISLTTRAMFKKMIWLPVVLVVLAGVAFLIFLGPTKKPYSPVVVIGLDGADWHIIDPLFEKGKLPNLRALVQQESWRILHIDSPRKSPVIWTSIITGMTMLKHGILGYRFVTENDIEMLSGRITRKIDRFALSPLAEILWNKLKPRNPGLWIKKSLKIRGAWVISSKPSFADTESAEYLYDHFLILDFSSELAHNGDNFADFLGNDLFGVSLFMKSFGLGKRIGNIF
jgi:hypothetical protein